MIGCPADQWVGGDGVSDDAAGAAGGTILDSHASLDPKMEPYLIDRKIASSQPLGLAGRTRGVAALGRGVRAHDDRPLA